MSEGDLVNDSNLSMNVHTGTHVDAPCHHLPGGAGAEALPLSAMIGEVVVMDVSATPDISPAVLEKEWPLAGARRVLFKTRNSNAWSRGRFDENYSALREDTADWLLARQVCLVGIDALSIQRFSDPPTVHRKLLGAGVVLLEGLDLSSASAGRYELLCLPIKLVGADGAPARAVLRRVD